MKTNNTHLLFVNKVFGTAPLSYQWYFNTNTLLPNATNTSLTLTNVQTNIAGWYSVIVTNSLGTTNATARLTVLTNTPSSGLIGWATVDGNTTGGAGGPTVTVTTAADLNTYATKATPYIIQVQGTINLTAAIRTTSNKTIIGLGTNATVIGSFGLYGVSNIIIQNLTIANLPNVGESDGITIKPAYHVWVDHCTFYDCPDGMVDCTHAADYITISWCKFYYINQTTHKFCNLVGGADSSTSDRGHLKITFHHNWWSTGCSERMPRGRFGPVHVFNCYYTCTGNSYCMDSGVEMQIRAENNYFKGVNNPLEIGDVTGALVSVGNIFDNTTGRKDTGGTVFTPPYAYTLDPAANVPAIVQAGAGPK